MGPASFSVGFLVKVPIFFSICSTHLYPQHSLGAARLLFRHERLSRRESFERVLYALNGSTALLLELSVVSYASQSVLFPEMCDLIRRLGFRYYEDIGRWRSPVDGTPLQKDVLFVRESAQKTNGTIRQVRVA
jgi:hypothetical protein